MSLVFLLFVLGSSVTAEVTRCDLASLLIRVEAALRENPQAAEAQTEIDARFDRASVAFFAGQARQAVSELVGVVLMAEARSGLGSNSEMRAAREFLSLRVQVSPFVVTDGEGGVPLVTAEPMVLLLDEDEDDSEPRGGTDPSSRNDALPRRSARVVAVTDPKSLEPGDAVVCGEFDLPQGEGGWANWKGIALAGVRELAPGRWWVRLLRDDGLLGPATPFYRTRIPLEEAGEVVIGIADGLPKSRETMWLKERAVLLRAARPRGETTAFVEDLYTLQQSLPRDALALTRGESPYRGVSGNIWLPIAGTQKPIPCRFHIPSSAPSGVAGDRPEKLPLVVAFHGAGGDENMFAFAYGGGALLRLAEERRVIVAMPLTYRVIGGDSGSVFDAIVDTANHLHEVDHDRIYVVGHSMGAAAAEALCGARSSKIAASALLMGAGGAGGEVATLVVAAGKDPLVPGRTILKRAEAAMEAGRDVTTRWLPDRGHTLAVGDVLPSVLDWLLERRLTRSQ